MAKRRNEPHEEPREDGRHRGDRQHAGIHRDFIQAGDGGRPVSVDEVHAGEGQHRAEEPSPHGEEQAFGEQQPDQRAPPGTEGRTDAELPRPLQRPGEEKRRRVEAGDEQKEARRAQEEEQNATGRTHGRVLQVVGPQAQSLAALEHIAVGERPSHVSGHAPGLRPRLVERRGRSQAAQAGPGTDAHATRIGSRPAGGAARNRARRAGRPRERGSPWGAPPPPASPRSLRGPRPPRWDHPRIGASRSRSSGGGPAAPRGGAPRGGRYGPARASRPEGPGTPSRCWRRWPARGRLPGPAGGCWWARGPPGTPGTAIGSGIPPSCARTRRLGAGDPPPGRPIRAGETCSRPARGSRGRRRATGAEGRHPPPNRSCSQRRCRAPASPTRRSRGPGAGPGSAPTAGHPSTIRPYRPHLRRVRASARCARASPSTTAPPSRGSGVAAAGGRHATSCPPAGRGRILPARPRRRTLRRRRAPARGGHGPAAGRRASGHRPPSPAISLRRGKSPFAMAWSTSTARCSSRAPAGSRT